MPVTQVTRHGVDLVAGSDELVPCGRSRFEIAEPDGLGRHGRLDLDQKQQIRELHDPIDALELLAAFPVKDLGVYLGIGQEPQVAADVGLEQMPHVAGERHVTVVFTAGEVQAERLDFDQTRCRLGQRYPGPYPLINGDSRSGL
ncbi:hypothetical protein ACGFI3_25650 [Nonomuraea wenchangensis]|uniref:hypothetical protein n=1 Tax=Nonomuraea wenchangensis TaxID=568860 RepID=UPI00371CB967